MAKYRIKLPDEHDACLEHWLDSDANTILQNQVDGQVLKVRRIKTKEELVADIMIKGIEFIVNQCPSGHGTLTAKKAAMKALEDEIKVLSKPNIEVTPTP